MSITAIPFAYSEDITGATSAADDPDMGSDPSLGCSDPSNPANTQTVWFRFVSPITGEVQANGFNSTYDTVFAVFTGTQGNLTLLACNDDNYVDLTSQVTVAVTAGQAYYFEVASYALAVTSGQLQFIIDVTRKDVANAYLQADVSMLSDTSHSPGNFDLGTTAGQPLLYGYPSDDDMFTSLTTVQVITGTAPTNYRLSEDILPSVQPSVDNSVLSTTWETSDFRAQQRLSFVSKDDPRYANMLAIQYVLTNLTNAPLMLGARVLLDVQVGDNPGPPFRLGNDTYTTEQDFTSFPDTWEVSQSPTFGNVAMSARGILRGTNVTTPDEVIVGQWGDSQSHGLYYVDWSYTTDPSISFTDDSAVALYFNPVTVPVGGSRTILTYYGLVTKSTFLPSVLQNHQ